MKPNERELSWFWVIQNPLIKMSLKARKEWALLRRDWKFYKQTLIKKFEWNGGQTLWLSNLFDARMCNKFGENQAEVYGIHPNC